MQPAKIAAAALGVALAFGGVYAVGLATDAHPPVIQGDTLGPEPGESAGDYAARTEASLSTASPEPAYALVAFDGARTPAEAAAAVDGVPRVSAFLLADAPSKAIPEPTAGLTLSLIHI